MKKLASLLIGCSLVLTGVAMAQDLEAEQSPKEKQAAEKGKGHIPEAKPGAKPEAKPGAKPETKPESNAEKPQSTGAKQHGATNKAPASKAEKAEATPQSAPSTGGKESKLSGQPGTSETPGAKQQTQEDRKGMKEKPANAKASPAASAATAAAPSATAAAAAAASAAPAVAPSASTAPVAAASASGAPSVSPAGQPTAQTNAAAAAKKPDPQQVQQIKAQHANFHAQPKPQQAPAVTFNPSYRIQGSDQWQGRQYEAFRSYHPERHDQGWYRSRYSRVELIGGGYYYFNSGYWYPAWGYNPSSEYYAYDGPIYVGHRSEPADQVIADVQAVLQQMGYYKGEVDGLLGPLTRQALTAYQADQGLTTTAAIDEPTLDSLGMG